MSWVEAPVWEIIKDEHKLTKKTAKRSRTQIIRIGFVILQTFERNEKKLTLAVSEKLMRKCKKS